MVNTTINILFCWFNGQNWHKDWQTANCLLVNNHHAQDIDNTNGLSTLKTLFNNKDKAITIECNNLGNVYEFNFQVNNVNYSLDSVNLPFA